MKKTTASVMKSVSRQRAVAPPKVGQMPLLRTEIEILAADADNLKKIAGAAALFISQLDFAALPRDAVAPAAALAGLIDKMSDEGMAEALQLIKNTRRTNAYPDRRARH